MTWNYRVVHRVYVNPDGTQCDEWAIHEAYYPEGADQDAIPESLSAEPSTISVDAFRELGGELRRFLRAAWMPVVEWSEVVKD